MTSGNGSAWKIVGVLASIVAAGIIGYVSILRADVDELRPRVRAVETGQAVLTERVLVRLDSIDKQLARLERKGDRDGVSP